MASRFCPLLLVISGTAVLLVSVAVEAQLSQNFYGRSCPKAESIAASIVRTRVRADRSMAASILRLHFHDCFVDGCDGSVLIDSTRGNLAEKDAPPNINSLRGFDVIDQIKTAVERSCPNVVSCADIVALAARDAIGVINGPSWRVPTGRRDGSKSVAAAATAALPNPNESFTQLKHTFGAVGLDTKDLVVLSGAHTIGQTHCSTISPRLYGFPGSPNGIDPSLDLSYARQLRRSCPRGSKGLVPLDPSRGGETFDVNYYTNVLNNRALFRSDESLLSSRSRVLGERASTSAFFSDFGASMEKMGRIGVLTGRRGNIRKNCARFNPRVSTTGKIAKTSIKKTSAKKTKTVKATTKKTSKKTTKTSTLRK